MPHLLAVEPFRETPNVGRCGPASLKMILGYFGVRRSEAFLARLAGTKRTIGTDAAGLLRAARRLGFSGRSKNWSTYRDIEGWLKRDIPVIVDWFSKGHLDLATADGHYSVVVGLDRRFIYFIDPEFGELRRLSRIDFRRVWFDYEGEYVKAPDDLIIRQTIVILPPRHPRTRRIAA